MKRYLIPTGFLGLLLLAACNDPSPVVCRPSLLRIGTDSIAFTYDGNGRISNVSYYDFLRHKDKEDILTYGSGGQLIILTKTIYPLVSPSYVDRIHTLRYDDLGRPMELVSESPFFEKVTTEFQHDDQDRLIEAKSTTTTQFIGTTRYEYDEGGNIPKVFYTLNLNHTIQEVLARENLSFDGTEKFYANVPGLKTCNEYVYGYLPTKNNCLSSKVHYLSYSQRFSSPLSVTFNITYNDQGLVQSLQTVGSSTQLFSGDVLFERAIYNCN